MNDGGPAFPSPYDGDCQFQGANGMSLRDYFAAKAMQAIVSKFSISEVTYEINLKVEQAYRIADAMIAERSKNSGG